MTARLEPVRRSFPHVQAVRVLRTTQADPGAIPMVMVLVPDGRRPLLPGGVDRLDLHDMKVGNATASRSFRRHDDAVSVDVSGKADDVRVDVLT